MLIKKKVLIITAVFIVIAVFVGLIICRNSLAYIHNQVDKRKSEIIDILKNNPDMVNCLVGELYPSKGEIMITYENAEMRYLENKKNKMIDTDLKNKLISVFDKLKCEWISVYNKNKEHTLSIFLGNVVVSQGNVYVHSLIYSENERIEQMEELLPGWYYDIHFYT